MIRWFLGTIGVLLIFGGVFGSGIYVGELRAANRSQAEAIAERDEANKGLQEQLVAQEQSERQAQADLVAVQRSIDAIEKRTSGIGGQLRSALSASNLAVCLLPADVQRLRADAYEQARDSATRANQTRDQD